MSVSREPAFVLFCPKAELDLAKLESSLATPFSEAGLEGATLRALDVPGSLSDSGWTAVVALAPASASEQVSQALSQTLAQVAASAATVMSEKVAGLRLEPSNTAEAWLAGTEAVPRRVEGHRGQVVREVADWLKADAAELARFLGGQRQRNVLRGAETTENTSVDEDDQFVREKLKAAAELMARYRASLEQR